MFCRRSSKHAVLCDAATSYVAHVGDNLRIWAERVAGITNGASDVVSTYDEHALAAGEQDDGKVLYLGPDRSGSAGT